MSVVYLTRDLLVPAHPRTPAPRDMQIELAVLKVGEQVATPHLPAARVLACWAEWPRDIPLQSIRAEFRKVAK